MCSVVTELGDVKGPRGIQRVRHGPACSESSMISYSYLSKERVEREICGATLEF